MSIDENWTLKSYNWQLKPWQNKASISTSNNFIITLNMRIYRNTHYSKIHNLIRAVFSYSHSFFSAVVFMIVTTFFCGTGVCSFFCATTVSFLVNPIPISSSLAFCTLLSLFASMSRISVSSAFGNMLLRYLAQGKLTEKTLIPKWNLESATPINSNFQEDEKRKRGLYPTDNNLRDYFW